MRALVTGGAGFIGAHLVRALVARGDEAVVFDSLRRGSRQALPGGTRLIEGDIRDADALERAVRGSDTVFHLAAQSNVLGAMDDVGYSFSTNVTGTFNALKASAEAGVHKFVFASSREVYGDQVVLPVCEAAPATARNPYGASKVAGEAYCRTWATLAPMKCAVLRLANVYGPGDRDRVIPLWLERAAHGDDLVVYGGRQVLDFVHVEVVVEAMLRAAETALPGPVNVGSGAGTPILGLAERIGGFAGGVRVAVEPPRNAEVVRFVANTALMREMLGIQPPADPLYGLEEMWRELRAGREAA